MTEHDFFLPEMLLQIWCLGVWSSVRLMLNGGRKLAGFSTPVVDTFVCLVEEGESSADVAN